MAIKVAEVQALRRAFNVTGLSSADERWSEMGDKEPAPAPALSRSQVVRPPPGMPKADTDTGEVIDVAEVVGAKPEPAPKGKKPDAPASIQALNKIRRLLHATDEEAAVKVSKVIGRTVTDLFELTELEAATAGAALEAGF